MIVLLNTRQLMKILSVLSVRFVVGFCARVCVCVWWHFGCGILRLSPPLSRSKQVVVVDCFEAIKRGGVHVSEPSVVFLWFGMCVCVCVCLWRHCGATFCVDVFLYLVHGVNIVAIFCRGIVQWFVVVDVFAIIAMCRPFINVRCCCWCWSFFAKRTWLHRIVNIERTDLVSEESQVECSEI